MSAITNFITSRAGVAALVGLLATILQALGLGSIIADQSAWIDNILLVVQGVSYILAAIFPSISKPAA